MPMSILRWIYDITPTTPMCVLLDIAKCRGVVYNTIDISFIPFDDIKKSLNDVLPFEINNLDDWDNNDLRKVATYVNPFGKWRKISLKIAYDVIDCHNKLKDPPFIKNFGPKTHNNPKSCDSITLYNFMKLIGIKTDFNMSFSQMTFLYTTFTFPKLESRLLCSELPRNIILEYLTDDKCSFIENQWKKDAILFNELPKEVKNSNEAFYVELKNGIDLSLSNCPLLDYLKIETSLIEYVNSINKYRTIVGTYFNPNIPIDYYPYKKIINLAKESNIDTSETYEIIYIKLWEKSKLSNFHHLRQPEVKNNITNILYEDLNLVDSKSIICYGILSTSAEELQINMEKKEMNAYTIQELNHSFKSMSELKEPTNGEILSDENIEKLEYIVNAISISPHIQELTKNDANDLIKNIQFIKARKGILGDKVSKWMESKCDDSIPGLLELLKASMYMRGWKGENYPYPIKKAPYLDQENLEIMVCNSIRNYYEKIENLNPSPNDLPLFQHDGKKFQISTDEYDGLTIGERLEKVLKGDNIKQMSSCIRMSSNWLITSSYFYLSLVGKKPNFNIEDLIDVG